MEKNFVGCFLLRLYICIYIYLNVSQYDDTLFSYRIFTSELVRCFLQSIPVLYFCIDVILTLSTCMYCSQLQLDSGL